MNMTNSRVKSVSVAPYASDLRALTPIFDFNKYCDQLKRLVPTNRLYMHIDTYKGSIPTELTRVHKNQ